MTDFEKLTDYDNLLEAHRQCRKGKTWKDSTAVFDLRALDYIDKLQASLINGTYRMSNYHTFRLSERGKVRTIKSTRYADRVVLRSLCDNVLAPRISQTFISGNGASQKDRGTDYMRLRLQNDLREHVRKHGPQGYILVGDFSGYFDSIPHDLLSEAYARYIEDPRILKLIADIHATLPNGRGLPLGNQTSQVSALLAASGIDHYIKEHLFIRGYGRYMDDFYLIAESREYLRWCLDVIQDMTEAIGLKLNQKKTKIVSLQSGITYLGFRFFVSPSGKVVIKAAKGKAAAERRRLKKLKARVDEGTVSYEQVQQSYQAWRAGVSAKSIKGTKRKFRPNTYNLVRAMDLFYYDLFADYLTAEERARYAQLEGRDLKGETPHVESD